MVRKWFNKLYSKVTGRIPMNDSMEQSRKAIAEHDRMVDKIYQEILMRIEKVCREKSEIVVSDLGFESMSMPLYPTSYQRRVVDLLSMDGYLCTVSIDYDGGTVVSSLKIRW